MNWKTALALVVLAAAAVVWCWKGDQYGPRIGLPGPAPVAAESESATALTAHVTPEKLTRIEILTPTDPVVLDRPNPTAGWQLPGGWPIRPQEVEELVALLGDLHSRFQPIPVAVDTDLTPYGLNPDAKPLIVMVTADGKPFKLAFGEPKPQRGQSPFTRPTYLRVDSHPEVLRLGPGLLTVLHRPLESYRRRQLFPDAERVKVATGGGAASPFAPASGLTVQTVSLPGTDVREIAVSGPGGTFKVYCFEFDKHDGDFTLKRVGQVPQPAVLEKGLDPAVNADRLADIWEISAPTRDHADPGKLEKLLEAIPDLWVDEFVTDPAYAEKVGLSKPVRSVTVKRANRDPIEIQFGAVSRSVDREEPAPPPQFGMPPMPPKKIKEEYRYAKLANNSQVFVVKADRIADLFVKRDEIVDPRPARFSPADVKEVVLAIPGKPTVKLTRKKGNAKADTPADRLDRWYVNAPGPMLAETTKVDELLTRLAELRSATTDRAGKQTPVKDALDPATATKVTIVAREKRADNQPDAPARTLVLLVAPADPVTNLLPVKLEGWPRVTMVDDGGGLPPPDLMNPQAPPQRATPSLTTLLTQPPGSYRGRRLFDTADMKLDTIAVESLPTGFTLVRESASHWKLTQPDIGKADDGKAAALAGLISGLEAAEYLTGPTTAEELAKLGLDKPRQTLHLTFTGPGGGSHKLELGAHRPGKPEVFARLDAGSPFAIADTLANDLLVGPLGLLPLRLWQVQPDKITALEITRADGMKTESYALTRKGKEKDFELTGPFTATVPDATLKPMLAALGNVEASRYEALQTKNPTEFGFDKPLVQVKLTWTETPPDGVDKPVTKTLVIGGQGPDGKSRYARLGGANTPVFLIPAAVSNEAAIPPLAFVSRKLLAIDPTKIVRIQISSPNPAESVTVVRTEGGVWKAEGLPIPVDSESITQMIRAIEQLPVSNIAAYGDSVKWSEYGLDPAELVVTVTTADPASTHTIKLGKMGANMFTRYARIDDGKALAVLDGPTAGPIARTRTELYDRQLLNFPESSLKGLTRTGGKGELELLKGMGDNWELVKPLKQPVDKILMEDLDEKLAKLRADRIAAFGPRVETLAKYGLDKPAATLSLTFGDKDKTEKKTLRLGNLVDPAKPAGEQYATVEAVGDTVSVGVLPGVLVKYLLAAPVAFRDHAFGSFRMPEKLIGERGDRKVVFTRSGNDWKMTEPVAAEADVSDLEDFLTVLGRLRVEEWVADKPASLKPFGLDKPEAKWTVFADGKEALSILIGTQAADGRVYVKAEKGDLVGLLSPDTSERVLAEYRKRRVWSLDAAMLQSVQVVDGKKRFGFLKIGQKWVNPDSPADAIDPRAVAELVGTLGALRAERFVADKDANLKLYGLDMPIGRITTTSPGGDTQTLLLGNGVGGKDRKQVYAMVEAPGRSDVFILSEADTMRLTRDRGFYVQRK